MSYQLHFLPILDYWELLAQGAAFTLLLTAIGTVFGIGIGILGAVCRAWQLRPLHVIFGVYVEFFRNTPFLVQLFFIFFGLPAVGMRMGAFEAAALAMVLNLGAYSTEIIRAGIQATHRGQIEAAASLGLHRAQVFVYVVLRPALARVWPALVSQVIIVMLGSAVVSQIAAEELTFAANFIQSRNFRAFETYFVTTAIYFLMALLLRQVLLQFGRFVILRRG
jgi:polar amino acid transport system permease protein